MAEVEKLSMLRTNEASARLLYANTQVQTLANHNCATLEQSSSTSSISFSTTYSTTTMTTTKTTTTPFLCICLT